MEYASSAFRDVCIQAALELAQADALAAAQTPEFVPSARFTRRMRRLLPHVKKNKYRSLTTAARVALVAALLALLVLSAVAARHYGFSLFNLGSYGLLDLNKQTDQNVEPLVYGYIPEGFVLTKEKYEEWGYAYANFTNEQGLMISISKQATYGTVSVNTENKMIYTVEKDGIEYSIIVSLKCTSVYWMDSANGTLYEIIGPFDAETLLKVAEDVR
ncbi:MAG: DUF4367 domain-containing protein [Clostridia bacterium]|nr:DUF4367 domain-containing protein [Clostridia bacterium]